MASTATFVKICAAYIHVLGGRYVDQSKTPLLEVIPKVFHVVNGLLSFASDEAKVGAITVDGWSSARSKPIMGMTVGFVDSSWQLRSLPVGLLNLEDLEKTAENQRAVMATMLRDCSRLSSDFLVHSGTSDNEASIALAVDMLTGGSGALRCLVHTLSLVMKTDVLGNGADHRGSGYIAALVARATAVANFVGDRPKVDAMLTEDQLSDKVTPDRVRTLKVEMQTRWYSALMVLESYFALHPNLKRVAGALTANGAAVPTLFDDHHMDAACEAIDVMREVRRVGRALEAEFFVTASRAPRLLWELFETWSMPNQFATVERKSSAGDDEALKNARSKVMHVAQVRQFAGDIARALKERLGAVWQKADSVISKESGEIAQYAPKRRALLLHMAAMFDVNECALDWLPLGERDDYYKELYKAVAIDKAQIDFSVSGVRTPDNRIDVDRSLFADVHVQMLKDLTAHGRRNADEALSWWRNVEKNAVQNVDATRFLTTARAFLAMQASSAAAERLFSDAGNVEGAKRVNQSTAMLEMNLVIRRWVLAELSSTGLEPGGNGGLLLTNSRDKFNAMVHKVARGVHNL